MNLKEFAALKAGDKIEVPMTNSRGTVTETTDSGVRVRWGAVEAGVAFFYSVNSTSWMHWTKAEAEDRILVCPYCGCDEPPNHKPGCTSALAQGRGGQ